MGVPMLPDFSVSLLGFRRAAADMDRAARRVAVPAAAPAAEDEFKPGKGSASGPDYAAELLSIRQAKIAAQANLAAIRTGGEVLDEVLETLARRS
jgi:hypothetical protein